MSNSAQRLFACLFAAALTSAASGQSLVHHVAEADPQLALGPEVAQIGDVDHDGVEDFAVTVRDQATFVSRTRLLSGLDASTIRELAPDNTMSISGCGDVDQDGTPDVVTGNPGFAGTGKATVISGATGLPLWTFLGDNATDGFGINVAGAGDANGDGVPDVLVGAWQYNPPFGNGPGYAKLFSGFDGSVLRHWVGVNVDTASFGWRVAGGGDINADGHDDQLVADPARNGGTVYVYSGLDGSVLKELAPFAGGSQFGSDLAGGRDYTGDGIPDVLVGAPGWGVSQQGRVGIWSAADWSMVFDFESQTANGYLGGSLDALDDVDGDGVPEVVVASKGDIGLPDAVGVIYVLSGADSSVVTTVTSETQLMGFSVPLALAGLGDVDGDGAPEFVVSTESADVRVYSTTLLAPVSYCPAKVNSQGCVPAIDWAGSPGATGPDDFVISCANLLNNVRGAVVWNTEPNKMPFMGGTLCVGTPWTVAGQFFSGGTPGGVNDCTGSTSFAITQAFLSAAGVGPGEPMFVQVLYRDPPQLDGTGWGLSDGVHFNVLP